MPLKVLFLTLDAIQIAFVNEGARDAEPRALRARVVDIRLNLAIAGVDSQAKAWPLRS